jgi:flagellar basal body-associated protein FliL
MADPAPAKPPTDGATPDASAAKAWWKSLLTGRWLAILIVGSLAFHSIVFVLVRKSSTKTAVAQGEFTVGKFTFTAIERANASSDQRPTTGNFDLHVRFIDDLDILARQRSVAHQFRVRESLENLLRKSKEVELDDAGVARLKHQIQQRIDEAIDLHAVAEVIITDLSIARGFTESGARPEPASAVSTPAENGANRPTATSTEPTSQTSPDAELGS